MKIDIVTIFPEMFEGPFNESIVRRAQEKNLVEVKIHNLRKWAQDKHQSVDDKPYGGGPGMVLMVEPIYKAIKKLKKRHSKVILLTPQGKTFQQKIAYELAKEVHLIFIAGHYEGVDERVRENLVDEEISIGDYVLTGGELPAMVVVDSVIRLIPGVLGDSDSLKEESFSNISDDSKEVYLEYPQYTRPEIFMGWQVPETLLSGNHQEIKKYRNNQAKKRTVTRRPDLIRKD